MAREKVLLVASWQRPHHTAELAEHLRSFPAYGRYMLQGGYHAEYPGWRVYRMPRRFYAGASRNFLLGTAFAEHGPGCDYYMFDDDKCLAIPALLELAAYLRDHPLVGGVQATDPASMLTVKLMQEGLDALPYYNLSHVVCFKGEAVAKVGVHTPHLRIRDDLEYSIRLNLAGWQTRYIRTSTKVSLTGPQDVGGFSDLTPEQRAEWMAIDNARLKTMHPWLKFSKSNAALVAVSLRKAEGANWWPVRGLSLGDLTTIEDAQDGEEWACVSP